MTKLKVFILNPTVLIHSYIHVGMISTEKNCDECYVQVATISTESAIEKASLLPINKTFTQHGLIKTNSSKQEQTLYFTSQWNFHESCTIWRKNIAQTTKISPHLSSINSLRFEGFYSYQHRYWQRYFVTNDGIVIHLMEDIPEAGGQNCLWAAGLVMAR